MISTHSAKNFRTMPSGTGAPRHEVLEPRADGHGLPAGVEISDPIGGRHHLADRRQPRSRRAREPRGQAIERLWRAGEQELVILYAPRGPVDRVATERARNVADRGVDRNPCKFDPRSEPALLAEMAEVGGEPVGDIDHRGDAAGLGEPLPLSRPRARPQV